jgi:hypothetical protein
MHWFSGLSRGIVTIILGVALVHALFFFDKR